MTEQDVGKYYCQVWANNMRTQSDRANLHYAGNVLDRSLARCDNYTELILINTLLTFSQVTLVMH